MKYKNAKLKINFLPPLENSELTRYRHGKKLPNSIRCIICGPSNCGKTHTLISLLTSKNGVCFKNIYIFSKTLNQGLYNFLKDTINDLRENAVSENYDYDQQFYGFSNNDEMINIDEVPPSSVMVFDDVLKEKQDKIFEYFTRGRHTLIDSFFITQTYTSIGKQGIRDNTNLLMVFKQDAHNLKYIFDEHVSPDMTLKEFQDLCNDCWTDKHDFLVIDKELGMNQGRYSKSFNCIIEF